MVLVDTNVVAHLLLAGEPGVAARALYELDPDWRSEPLLFFELTNVLTTSMRNGGASRSKAMEALDKAHQIFDHALHAVSDRDALDVAAQFRISGYDARFIAAATALGSRLVTEDARLRKAVPTLTCSLAEALAR
ncbi:MAG TPA: type II toxin-antitoxin system VapC family toxin [Burkholderiaceae bacterium]|nr:type II toxin-antitoxin system VapC family toxin [Burkholderiaceae bacterium]